MARAMRAAGSTIRAEYLDVCIELAEMYGDLEPRFWNIVRDLEAGEDVVVNHGWEINLHAQSGPWLLRGNGSLVHLESHLETR